MRPVLAPAAQRLWRGTGTLQVRLSPTRAVLVEGLDVRTRALLPLLDGVRTREQVLAAAGDAAGEVAEALLDTLEAEGLLLDADQLQVPLPAREDRERLAPDLAALTLHHRSRAGEALRARRAARVVLHGAGRVGAPLAALLVEAGVGTVDVRDDAVTRWEDVAPAGLRPHDVGRPRQAALAARLRSDGSSRTPSVVVLTDELAERVPEALCGVLLRDRVPHLPAAVSGLTGVVGPLVLPGQSSCLGCLELVRAGIDPDWPALLAVQEETAVLAAAPSHVVLATAVAAQTAMQVLELLEGGAPASIGGTLELELPGWRWRRRTWPAHPACRCRATDAEHLASA